ncbi:hypothetical protein KP509_1Z045000 [Ceratopteris richardii]|nr:hypothetical protein KP509_1Z045000 [Ceratopteris richardii]KAH6558796.1 hypothetical protein KP509_1Z045000 [Ceratopteris richardii]
MALKCYGDRNENQRPGIQEVAATVPITDDPNLPVMTFRMWFLGILSCILLMFLNTFFSYRTQPLAVAATFAQILTLPMGRFMAAALPTGYYAVPLFGWKFTLNPGPFNIKEHVLITIFANAGVSFGGGDAYSVGIVNIIKAFYKKNIHFVAAFIIVLTTQVLGYGWAGMFRSYLVEPVGMWWPSNLVQVTLFRTLHETDIRKKRKLTRMQYFIIVMVASFAYYILPGYLFSIVTFFSWVCWVWPDSIRAHQIGSGFRGLGIGAISFDWAGISSYLGSPLVTPWFSIANIGVGFLLFTYIIIPITYWANVYQARKFALFSSQLFTDQGNAYNVTRVMTSNFAFDTRGYESYSKLYLSTFFALSTGFGFARITATVVHVILFHGKEILQQSRSTVEDQKLDVHSRLMKAYRKVPQSWFIVLLFVSLVLSLTVSIVWEDDVQLAWWGVLLACGVAAIFTLPIGVITATTNQPPGFNVLAEFLIGYLQPGKPIANALFKTYGRISMSHSISFLADLKLGHYMKIPPRCMYTAQLAGTLLAGTVNISVAWWMLTSIDSICDAEALQQTGSPWTCPKDRVAYDASVLWGLVGPKHLFGSLGIYRNLTWFFLIGAVLPFPFWILGKLYPKVQWIASVNIPVFLGGFATMPPATPVNIFTWLIVGAFFNFFMFRFRREWWKRYNYVLSAALDAGTAFMGVLIYLSLGLTHKKLQWWGTQVDHCSLAQCPTAPGISIKGCPII